MSALDFLFGPGGLEKAAATVWAQPARDLVEALGLAKSVAKLGADAAIPYPPAATPPRAWLVLSGSADLFLLRPGGARLHVLRVPAGGLALSLEGADFLLVPSNGAELVETDLSALLALGDEAARAGLAEALDRWLEALAAAGLQAPPPAGLETLGDALDVDLDGAPVGSQGPAHWLPVESCDPAWPEPFDEAAAGLSSPAYRPVLPALWLTPQACKGCRPLATARWLATPGAPADLAAVQAFAVARLQAFDRALVAREAARLEQVRATRSGALTGALSRLAGVVSDQGAQFAALPHEPHAAAAVLVWRSLGLDRRVGAIDEKRIAEAGDPVQEVARAGGFFVRKVRLLHGWQERDHGPLLGFVGAERRPCALLPAGRARYRLVDPAGGREQPVDPVLAGQVADEAHQFVEPLPDGRLSARQLLGFGLRQGRRDITALIVMALMVGLLSLVTPVVTGWVMDPVIPDAELGQLAVLVAALVVAGVASAAFSLVQSLAMLRMEGRMGNRVESAVWDRLLRLPASFFRSYTVGDLANRAQSIDAMRQLMTGSVTATLLHSVSGTFSLVLMIYYGWRLALIAVLGSLVYALVVILIGKRILGHNRETMFLTGRIQGIVLQLLTAVSKLRIAGAEANAFGRWAEPYAELLTVGYAQARQNANLVVFKTVFHFLTIVLVLGILAWQGDVLWSFLHAADTWAKIDSTALHKIITTGHFVAFNTALGQFLAATFGIATTLVKLWAVKPLYERVRPILEAEPEPEDGADDPGELMGGLEIRDVVFRYAEGAPTVLNGLSLSVRPGQMAAIVGPSGAGKSTLVRLLLGFEEPESGSVFFDGKDIRRLNKRRLRRQLGVVLQNGRLLSGSLFHNIVGGANLTRDDAMAAARLAGLDKDIEQMPMGLDTYVGEGATTLSGGQRQRLMIARAVVNRPRILIFDEATSALDNETQATVTAGLDKLKATRIVIAHRLSTIVRADRIFVIDKGVVVEQGSYDELMKLNGLFAQLAKRQLA